MNQQIIEANKEQKIKKIYNAIRYLNQSEDAHWVETPASLVDEMISNINLNGKILVLFNVDIMMLLLKVYEVPASDIVFLSDDSVKDKLCDKFEVKYINSIEELKEMNMKFDVVIGNPPYQDPTRPRHKLWPKFISKSLDISNTVAIIAPKTASQMLNGQEVDQTSISNFSVRYYNGYDVDRHFKGIGSDFCYFIITKDKLEHMNIKTEKGWESLKQGSYIPYDNNPLTASIISKTMNFKNDYGRSAARVTPDVNGRNKCIETIKKAGPVWAWSSQIHRDTNKPKMIYPTLGFGEYLDREGCVMPTTSFAPYIVVDKPEELDDLLELQSSQLFGFLMNVFSSMRSPRDYVWKNISKNRKMLTQEEIDYIESNVK